MSRNPLLDPAAFFRPRFACFHDDTGARAAGLQEEAARQSELCAERRRARLYREDERARVAVTQRSLCIHRTERLRFLLFDNVLVTMRWSTQQLLLATHPSQVRSVAIEVSSQPPDVRSFTLGASHVRSVALGTALASRDVPRVFRLPLAAGLGGTVVFSDEQ